ncbi:hypothetical protein HPB47_021379 [Ixodes persulcatus]|uniref:Uncharacterized protein n=1 Tax=Ixodes persulcatus TaxID=34615 RepID=A0AC60QCY0_IXOPE|nr:hypothetical protein HPB47_021379 [Ixodes persulcatus]
MKTCFVGGWSCGDDLISDDSWQTNKQVPSQRMDIPIQAFHAVGGDQVRGVIYGIDPNEDPEQLLPNLASTTHWILAARPMGKNSKTALVTFEGNRIPRRVWYHNIVRRVFPYRPKAVADIRPNYFTLDDIRDIIRQEIKEILWTELPNMINPIVHEVVHALLQRQTTSLATTNINPQGNPNQHGGTAKPKTGIRGPLHVTLVWYSGTAMDSLAK